MVQHEPHIVAGLTVPASFLIVPQLRFKVQVTKPHLILHEHRKAAWWFHNAMTNTRMKNEDRMGCNKLRLSWPKQQHKSPHTRAPARACAWGLLPVGLAPCPYASVLGLKAHARYEALSTVPCLNKDKGRWAFQIPNKTKTTATIKLKLQASLPSALSDCCRFVELQVR